MEATAPKISIIIPVYRVELHLPRCIDSILEQTFTDFELLLIDDGSPDNSGKICDEYARKDQRVRVSHKENGGVSSARNLGLRMAKGKWICFVDSDDWVDKTYLSDFFLFPVSNNSITIQGISYEFKNHRKILFSYTDKSYDVNSIDNAVVDNELFHNGCPVAKLFDLQIIKSNNIVFNESISLNEDHLFVLEYFKYVEHISLLSAMNYHYWFDYFEISLTKKSHGFTKIMTASQGYFDVLPVLITRYQVTDHEYLCKLYTTCGINQMFKALIHSYYSKNIELPFSLRFARFIELSNFISEFYFPKEFSLKVAKYVVLTFNGSINNIFFFILAKSLFLRKKLVRFVKSILKYFSFYN